MSLSVNDLSSCFGVRAATVERWVRQGRIAAFSQEGSLRFRKKDIEKWAAQQNIQLNLAESGKGSGPGQDLPSLFSAFENGGVYQEIQGASKDEVLAACIEQMTIIPEDFKLDLLERIKEREAAMSTGIGNGIAIPHPRESVSYLARSAVVTCFPASPVAFDAVDNRPVQVIFFLLSTTLAHHLPLLSSLSRCLKDPAFQDLIASRPDAATLIATLKKMEL